MVISDLHLVFASQTYMHPSETLSSPSLSLLVALHPSLSQLLHSPRQQTAFHHRQPAGLTASNLITANGHGTPVKSATTSSPSFGHAIAGWQKVGKAPMFSVVSRVNKVNGSSVAQTAPLPLVTPPSTTLGMEVTGVDRMGGQWAQLPQG